jgi:triosephosphate isomerase
MLRDVGCNHVLVGHSERRTIFGERGEILLKKLDAAFREGLIPILCVGENLEEREAGRTAGVLDAQLDETLFRIAPDGVGTVVLAYEPVWAIGTGLNATPQQVVLAHRHIRSRLEAALGARRAEGIRILYGGSVNGKNAGELLACPGVDGALVGGASLRAEEFLTIAHAAPRRP